MEVASCHPSGTIHCLGGTKVFEKFVKPLCYALQYHFHKNSFAVIICKLLISCRMSSRLHTHNKCTLCRACWLTHHNRKYTQQILKVARQDAKAETADCGRLWLQKQRLAPHLTNFIVCVCVFYSVNELLTFSTNCSIIEVPVTLAAKVRNQSYKFGYAAELSSVSDIVTALRFSAFRVTIHKILGSIKKEPSKLIHSCASFRVR